MVEAAVLKKAALARATLDCWPPLLDKRATERVTSFILTVSPEVIQMGKWKGKMLDDDPKKRAGQGGP